MPSSLGCENIPLTTPVLITIITHKASTSHLSFLPSLLFSCLPFSSPNYPNRPLHPPCPPASLINSALLTLTPLSRHPSSPPRPSQTQETIIIRTAPSNPFVLILPPFLAQASRAKPNPQTPPSPKHNLVIDTPPPSQYLGVPHRTVPYSTSRSYDTVHTTVQHSYI